MKLNSRYLGALIIAPFIGFVFLGGLPLKLFIIAISLIGMYEFYRAIRKSDFNPISVIGYGLLLLYYLVNNKFETLFAILILALIILLIMPVINLKYNFIDVSLTLFGFIYIGVLFSFIYLVSIKENGNFYVWLVFLGAWITDTFAYYCGRLFGKTKLSPRVSPKKTLEGSIGGLLGASLVCGLFGYIIGDYINTFSLYHFFIIGAICGVISQFGDLVASSIKRFVGIKDYGNLIPGHGGILDRFDSILFSGVVVYYYLSYIIK